ncbi:D-ribose pyranase [Halomonas koreensis]|uniref:D-ribose pyranase n=1 Tax=Halomonas koreensis TaxID=245385 RepID=A0ABU1G245_9GAMM|nr:D-ribose pyranase [Halomonas koreensis]MDR5866985.1 D-ribose pyranase [Halomonas koreensis]
MKRHGLLNAPLSALIAELGHTDTLILADAGLPIPPGVPRVDLAVTPGLPGFLPVLEALLDELCLEGVTLARETVERRPELTTDIERRLARLEARDGRDIAVARCDHADFKALLPGARAVIRTGECTPYANLALHSGVPF